MPVLRLSNTADAGFRDRPEPVAGRAKRPRRLALAEAVDRKPALPETLRVPGEIAVGSDQQEPVEPRPVTQVDGVYRERDVRRVLAPHIRQLVARHDGLGADRSVPRIEPAVREVAIDAPHGGLAELARGLEHRLL